MGRSKKRWKNKVKEDKEQLAKINKPRKAW